MTSNNRPAPKRVDVIKADLASPATTTAQTLNLLRAVLGLHLPVKDDQQECKPVGTKLTKQIKPRGWITGAPRRPTKKPPVVIHEDKPAQVAILDSKARKDLATTTFNTTLKSISSTAKLAQEKIIDAGKAQKSISKQQPASPLKECSPNRQAKQKPAKPTAENARQLESTVECAIVALEGLRQLEAETNGRDTVDLRLEQGASILLDKIITLGMSDHAERQLRILHEQYWKRRKSTVGKDDKDGTAQLPLVVEVDADKTLFKFATSLQSHFLRLAILKGPSMIDEKFVDAVRLEAVGSPANAVLEGLRLGHLGKESCGIQLRTISLALSKLHSVSREKPKPSSATVGHYLQLATIALQIKIHSWKYLGHKPDLDKELWAPAKKHMQRYLATKQQTVTTDLPEECVKMLRSTLLLLEFKDKPPSDEKTPVVGRPASKAPKTARVDDTTSDILRQLDAIADIIDTHSTRPEAAIESLGQLLSFLAEQRTLSRATLPTVFLGVARIRKALLSISTFIEQNVEKGKASQSDLQLQVACVRAVYSFSSLVVRCLQPSSSSLPETTKITALKQVLPDDDLALPFAKTAEAVLLTDNFAITRSAILNGEAVEALQCLLKISELVRDTQTASDGPHNSLVFFNGIPLRVSQAFWIRYLWLTENRRSTPECIKSLEHSLGAVQGRSLRDRQDANFSLKCERLASLLAETRSYEKGAAAIQSALEMSSEQGLLTDVTEAYVLQLSDRGWDNPNTNFYSLGRNLAFYARLRLQSSQPSESLVWYYDREDLPPLHRSVMLERQIITALQTQSPITKEQLKHSMQHVQTLLSDSEQPLYGVRFASQMLYLLERSKAWDPRDFFTHEAVHCMLASSDAALVRTSNPALLMIRHTVSLQWALVTGNIQEDLLLTITSNLKAVFARDDDAASAQDCGHTLHILSAQLNALADFAGVLGNDKAQLDVLMIQQMLSRSSSSTGPSDRLSCLVKIGSLQNRLDKTADAGRAFAQAENLLLEADTKGRTLWHLSYAEYLFNVKNNSRCSDLLLKASEEPNASEDDTSVHLPRLDKDTSLSHAAYLASKVAFQQGLLGQAVFYAKQAARLSTSLWLIIEKKCGKPTSRNHDDSAVMLAEEMSNLILTDQRSNIQYLEGAKFWSSISIHRDILSHVALVFSHLGLYQDACYYAQQAHKVSEATGGQVLQSLTRTRMALLYASAGKAKKAQTLLSIEGTAYEELAPTNVDVLLTRCEAYMGSYQYEDAKACLQTLHDLNIPWLGRITAKSKPAAKTVVRQAQMGSKKKTKVVSKQAVTNAVADILPAMTVSQTQLRARLEVLENTMRQCFLPSVEHNISNVMREAGLDVAAATVSTGLSLMHDGLTLIAADPTSNTLAETALALPVKYKLPRKSGQLSVLSNTDFLSPLKTSKSTKLAETLVGLQTVGQVEGPKLLSKAFEMLRLVDDRNRSQLSSAVVAKLFKALSQITLMSAALALPFNYSPATVVLQTLIPKEVSRSREEHAIRAETMTISSAQLQRWPGVPGPDLCAHTEALPSDLKELLQALPLSWTIVSVGLSQDCQELLLSKIQAGTSPFLMRVPLGRPDIEGNEPDEFTFESAKAELLAIVSQANETCHDIRGQGNKQQRNAWYAEREALDRRLKTLLANIENVWLGGFRGLLVSQGIDETLLARFSGSLTQSLDNHLPSRQKANKSAARVQLHARVLELFVGLPFDNSPELDDSITDLLYFVIDILQFNDEPNAYDEIDFDAILVDVLDALRAFQNAHISTYEYQSTHHTILVLDKELEAFPWESLPCLQSRPVSRMPSLGAIKTRLDLIRAQSATADFLSVPASQGAYILNPSSDLAATQQTFESTFSTHLSSWTSLINNPPTSSQFSDYLENYPLLLYFGHGSGAQYILKRKIRSMKKCAVTWLMGCGSAKMIECGIFESHGMPNVYIHGGSAAVVGTLWDVTDRDLDRCAMRGLGLWGLLEEGEEGEKGRGKKAPRDKGKGKAEEVDDDRGKWKGMTKEERRGNVALDEAVCAGRDACRLRYLNGAAVVVYGIPVVLE